MARFVIKRWDGNGRTVDPSCRSGLIEDGVHYWQGAYIITEYDTDTMSEYERVELLTDLINHHDFYYEFSDDHRWWSAGRDNMWRIRTLGDTLDPVLVNQIWANKFGEMELFAPLYRIEEDETDS